MIIDGGSDVRSSCLPGDNIPSYLELSLESDGSTSSCTARRPATEGRACSRLEPDPRGSFDDDEIDS